ncbi:hypothetical protein JCM3774_003556 [Rhodotorula dairenensis]
MQVTLPPELVSLCLSQLDPADPATVAALLSASLASSAFRSLATAHSLWVPVADHRYHRYRGPPAASTPSFAEDAYGYYVLRATKDRRAVRLVREIEHRPVDRLPLVDELRRDLGSDVIEHLARVRDTQWTETNLAAEPRWLSLRYWAAECRKALLRDEALRLWREIAIRSVTAERAREAEAEAEADDDLERGLDAFSAFRGLDPARLASERYDLSNHPRLVEETADLLHAGDGQRGRGGGTATLEWLATRVVEYMRSIGLKPAREGGFHSLDNHYVELVWQRASPPHGPRNEGTLPLTLVSIFCSLVRRLPAARQLGIRAHMIGYPGTVLAGLSYAPGPGPGGGSGGDARIYINVFGEGKILSPERLRAMLGAMGQVDTTDQDFLRPATASEMCLRVARNILTSVRAGDRTIGVPITHDLSVEALYSVSHALFLFTSPRSLLPNDPAAPGADTLQYAEWLESLIQSEYPLDVAYLTEIVGPVLSLSTTEPNRRARLDALCAAIRDEDATPKEPKPATRVIRWPALGHVFRHRLFGYLAITRGYDYRCEAGEQWIRQMRVDTLPYGRDQPFYHVVVEDGSARYVAQENITAEGDDDVVDEFSILDESVAAFLEQESLGRYFCRRERLVGPAPLGGSQWRFVPSEEVAAEYPDSVTATPGAAF